MIVHTAVFLCFLQAGIRPKEQYLTMTDQKFKDTFPMKIVPVKTFRFHRFHFRKHLARREDGFTLAELLIVVAIIGVLVAISIPIFNAQMEKARQAVDMHTARSIESVLVAACNSGDITLPDGVSDRGVWVMFCKKGKRPQSYNCDVLCGADEGFYIKGNRSPKSNSPIENSDLHKILAESGFDHDSLTVRSNGNQKDGWDWIVVEVGYDTNKKLYTRFYSGFQGTSSAASRNTVGTTNIEKKIYGDQK